MNRTGHENNNFFTGVEVEHSPAFGLRTLFVVGVQSNEEIQDWIDDLASYEDKSKHIEHIYFGANQSFPNLNTNDALNWAHWEDMITPFLDKGYLCTLDIDIKCVEGLLESAMADAHNFIPMISVKLPYTKLLNYNTTIKIDDIDFNKTNPGVWCHSLHSLTNKENFTPWIKYAKDKPI